MGKTRAELISAGRHLCHWPTCTTPVPPKLWGCKAHWFRLPKFLRDRIWATYVQGQEERLDPTDEYLRAAEEIQRYIQGEIAAGRAS